ncbi:MAG: hypothetical protein IPI95_07750 [Flavobacteriales bacterium]|nr:hypothetical protein [Flavobacteriales bacterium]
MSKELPTLVMGASLKVDRYSNRAIHAAPARASRGGGGPARRQVDDVLW